jgi:anti-sigma factor RsiW
MSDWLDKVHAHADGELDAQERAEAEAILSQDPRAAAEHQWAVYLKETLRSRHMKPDHTEAWSAAVGRLDAVDALAGDNRAERFVGRFSWGFAAALFVVIVFAGLLNRGGGGQLSDRELAGLFTGNPLTATQDVQGADEADSIARREIGAALPKIEPLVRPTKVGTGEIDGRRFLQVDFEDNVGTFNLFIIQGADGVDQFERVSGRSEFFGGQVNGKECVGWAADGMTYLVAGQRSVDELVQIAARMRR